MASRKRFRMTADFNGRNGNETPLWRHCYFEHCCVSALVRRSWGRFWSQRQTLFYSGNGQRVHPLFGGQYLLIFVVVCPIAGLQISIAGEVLSFGSWGNFKVLTLDFEWLSSEVHYELETKRVISRISWAHQQWRHKFYFRQISDNFPDRSTITEEKRQWFQHSNISAMFCPIRWKLQNMYILYFMNILNWNEKHA